MTLVFQYGSNMCSSRLNSADRLANDAILHCVAKTVELFEFEFTVLSKTNNCAAANIVPSSTGQQIFGVLYDIPDFLISRDTARSRCRKSMDAIEGEGMNYVKTTINLEKIDGSKVNALTYVAKNRNTNIKTSRQYIQHILDGLDEHNIPEDYRQYVTSQVIANNADLA